MCWTPLEVEEEGLLDILVTTFHFHFLFLVFCCLEEMNGHKVAMVDSLVSSLVWIGHVFS